jgi:predicted phage terminase large subunit-like protein
MSRDGTKFYIEDLVHGRWSPGPRNDIILQTAQVDGRAVEVVIEQEPGSAGVAQVAQLVAMLAGYRVSGRRSTGDKITRAGPLASQMEAGNVLLVQGAWNQKLVDEMCSFPSAGIHDDIVDACSSAFLVLSEQPVNPLAGIVAHAKARGW